MKISRILYRWLWVIGGVFLACIVVSNIPFFLQGMLVSAAARGDMAGVKMLLTVGVDPNAPLIDDFHTGGQPLIAAATNGQTAVVEELIKRGATVDLGGCCGESALMEAGSHGQINTMKALLAAGANPNYDDGYGETAISLAGGHNDEIKLLKHAGAKK